jgi:hypothetical protein
VVRRRQGRGEELARACACALAVSSDGLFSSGRASETERNLRDSGNGCCWGRGSGFSRVLFSSFNVVSCPPAQRAHAQAGARGGYKHKMLR